MKPRSFTWTPVATVLVILQTAFITTLAPGCTETPVAPNTVQINEVACRGDDWVELVATGDTAVSLEGWRVSDGSNTYELRPSTVLYAGDHLVLYQGRELTFGFRCGEEAVVLREPAGGVHDRLDPPALLPGQTWGRRPDGAIGLLRPTAGAANEVTPLFPEEATGDSPELPTGDGPCAAASAEWGLLVCADHSIDGATLEGLTIEDTFNLGVERFGKFTVPTVAGDPASLPPLIQNTRQWVLHQEFLVEVFPERFAGLSSADYAALVLHRETRRYFAGTVYVLAPAGTLAFSLATDPSRSEDTPTAAEVATVHDQLSWLLDAPLAWVPLTVDERAAAASWTDPPCPIHLLDSSEGSADFEVYTAGVAVGTVRVLELDELSTAIDDGTIGWQHIVVLDRTPADIETVVQGIITGERQTELSHVAIRSARRGTPNLYQAGAHAVLGPYDGAIVRLSAYPGGYVIDDDVTEADAEAFWDSRRPTVGDAPVPDLSWDELTPLSAIDVATAAERAAAHRRFGAKATNLAVLVDLSAREDRVDGFVIPFHWFDRFMDENHGADGRTYAELVADWQADERFRSDPGERRRVLDAFASDSAAEARLPDGLEERLIARIEEVFGGSDVMVRFRSSSNAEDLAAFSGAGLYTSQPACAADTVDGDDELPSRCDANTASECPLAEALAAVWTSLYGFRAWEERSYYGLGHDPDEVAMAVLVTVRFIHEQANGVLVTTVPESIGAAGDDLTHFLVNAQWGEVPVVAPITGTLAERTLLSVDPDSNHLRLQRSNVIAPGFVVLPTQYLDRLATRASGIAEAFPLDETDPTLGALRLELEWKFDREGRLVVKQVRPIAEQPSLEPDGVLLALGSDTTLCSTFIDDRGIWRERELRGRLSLRSVQRLLPFDTDAFPQELDWVTHLELGPEATTLWPTSPGLLTLEHDTSWQEVYHFRFEQVLGGPDNPVVVNWERYAYAPLGEVPPGEVVHPLGEISGVRACLDASCSAADDRVELASCRFDHLDHWEHIVRVHDPEAPFHTIRILTRHREEPVESGPIRILYADLTHRDGTVERVSDFFAIAYATLRHNRSEDFLFVLAGEPARLLLVDEPDIFEQQVVRVELLSVPDLEQLEAFETDDWERELVP